jgi:hypothetical protein
VEELLLRTLGYLGGASAGPHGLVEDCLPLSIDKLLRERNLVAGQVMTGVLTWTTTRENRALELLTYSSDLTANDHGWLRITSLDGRQVDQIRLTTTIPRFGGRRWWFVCPFTGARVGKLFRPAGVKRFAGRKAHGLAYRSQREDGIETSHNRVERAARKLGNEYRAFGKVQPRRPKGMHHRTYARLMMAFWEASDDHVALSHARLQALLAGDDRTRSEARVHGG